MVAASEMANVLSRVASWPIEDRVELAQKILETVRAPHSSSSKGRPAEDVIRLMNIQQPAPSDIECAAMLDEELIRKYGR